LDQDAAKTQGKLDEIPTAEGTILTRNDLLERLLGPREQQPENNEKDK
jgi:hypothetical protein